MRTIKLDAEALRSSLEPYIEAYADIYSYGIRESDGALCYLKRTGKADEEGNEIIEYEPVADFAAIMTEETLLDDGVEASRMYTLQGYAYGRKPLPPIEVNADRFNSMTWLDKWGSAANVRPGRQNADRLKYAIKDAAKFTAIETTAHTHTGFKEIDGKLVYLHNGGAIGADGIQTKLPGKLNLYTFPKKGGDMRHTLDLLKIAPARIAYPLIAYTYLAPLGHFLKDAPVPVALSPEIVGRTQSGKTTLCALLLCHYGTKFTDKNLPASFKDSPASLRDKAFRIKDALLLVDDFHPEADSKEHQRMLSVYNTVSAMGGDGDSADRANPDGTLKTSKPPRGSFLITAEYKPDVAESRNARIYTLNIAPGDVLFNEDLNRLQQMGRDGTLAAGMRSYIEFIIDHADGLTESLLDTFTAKLRDVQSTLEEIDLETMKRQPVQIAWLLTGLHVYLRVMKERGEMTEEEASSHYNAAHEILIEEAKEQAAELREESPAAIFVDTLRDMLITGKISLYTLDAEGKAERPAVSKDKSADVIGYDDPHNGFIYLLPGVAYGKVCTHLQTAGRMFPLRSDKALGRQLKEYGAIEPRTNKAQTPAREKKIPGRYGTPTKVNVWYLRRSLLIDDPSSGKELRPAEAKRAPALNGGKIRVIR